MQDNKFTEFFEDGIYDDGSNYFNYNIKIPNDTPEELKNILEQMGQYLKEGRTIEFFSLFDQVDCLVRWSHSANMISRESATTIFSILGWEYYG